MRPFILAPHCNRVLGTREIDHRVLLLAEEDISVTKLQRYWHQFHVSKEFNVEAYHEEHGNGFNRAKSDVVGKIELWSTFTPLCTQAGSSQKSPHPTSEKVTGCTLEVQAQKTVHFKKIMGSLKTPQVHTVRSVSQ